jgi:hypothetical protein
MVPRIVRLPRVPRLEPRPELAMRAQALDPMTPNLGFTQPTVGGSVGVWGGELNNNWSIIDNMFPSGLLSPQFLAIRIKREPLQQPDGTLTSFVFTGQALSVPSTFVFLGGLFQDPDGDDCAIVIGGGTTTVSFGYAPALGQRLLAFF